MENFLTCAVLHNMMLSKMVRAGMHPRFPWGVHLASDGIWLEGPLEMLLPPPAANVHTNKLKEAFDEQQTLLCNHVHIWREKNKRG